MVISDSTIDDNELFYIGKNGRGLTKASIKNINSFQLENLLTGIWHYVITKRADNSIGSETYINWHSQPASKNGRRKFISTLGGDLLDAITIHDFSDVAPKLTDQPPLIVLPASFLYDESDATRNYLRKAEDKYCKLKTLLYADNPKPFYDFYVCNDISQKIRINKNSYSEKVIRHLLLDSIEKYDDGRRIPIFITLKDYTLDYDSLTSYIFDKFSCLCDEIDITD